MAATRKNVRDALVEALQHGTTGLNAQIATLAAAYSLAAFTFDWAAGSKQFIQAFLTPEAVDMSKLIVFPSLVLYTSTAQSQRDREKFRKFTGDILAHLDFYFEYRVGMEGDNTEAQGDLIEDAIIELLNASRSIFESKGVYWNGDFASVRDPIVQFEDGWAQRVPIGILMEVVA